ncbi:hypothetical protein WISP_142237 [Willisornis vidua]|uniref:Uncharacterized protein n=1 Tax=Willisornis vidua TaxID=1566151 RepID=A0ABQ9CLR9_9PASS|nr:hypothetical protein WISP_142237 [Willisornis vidua]
MGDSVKDLAEVQVNYIHSFFLIHQVKLIDANPFFPLGSACKKVNVMENHGENDGSRASACSALQMNHDDDEVLLSFLTGLALDSGESILEPTGIGSAEHRGSSNSSSQNPALLPLCYQSLATETQYSATGLFCQPMPLGIIFIQVRTCEAEGD